MKDNVIATTWKDGPYLLVVKIEPSKPDANWNLTGVYFLDKHCVCVMYAAAPSLCVEMYVHCS